MTQVVKVDGGGRKETGEPVTLSASLDPEEPAAESWTWERQAASGATAWVAIPDESDSSYSFTADSETASYSYRAVAIVGGNRVESDAFSIVVIPAPVWHEEFAGWAAGVGFVAVVVFVLTLGTWSSSLGLSDEAYAKLDGRAIVAVRVIGPLAFIGVATLVLGLWMAVVEWRGRFRREGATDGLVAETTTVDIPKVIEALSKVKGYPLVVLVGLVILLGVVSMTSATSGANPPSTTVPAATTTTPEGD